MQTKNLFHHQFWIFWIGLLTGALIVGLIFSYQAIQSQNLKNALLKYYKSSTTPTMNTMEWDQGN